MGFGVRGDLRACATGAALAEARYELSTLITNIAVAAYSHIPQTDLNMIVVITWALLQQQ